MTLSSSGYLRSSRRYLLNSGSSSINKTPLCAREISPGKALVPPPVIAIADEEW